MESEPRRLSTGKIDDLLEGFLRFRGEVLDLSEERYGDGDRVCQELVDGWMNAFLPPLYTLRGLNLEVKEGRTSPHGVYENAVSTLARLQERMTSSLLKAGYTLPDV